ncbi:U3 small nucleolar RNA-associated protein 10 [Candida viswanathii]|uniref:U3 small nucleolar RNA-associated protein 10 n=1 Tax=Candida viswanathii TaxID=5486 RepID=A0A367YET4_9ASCO|nr:U3 small nucleolar RNA-associated protein 10 [Candida viswanathii]
MSSLASQLQSINEKTASIALDRKQRSKLHSRSLIFDPKVAAGQDYEYIYDIAVEGLDDLCELDSRFNKFKQTLFSETSVTLDRNLQSKEVIDQLNKNIDVFLTLVGPYYALTSSLKAVEWLVRRFHANIHNAEVMVLTALPYYQQPLFIKVLNVIPKQNFPKILEWVVGYKDLLKNPPSSSILKAFYNDFPLFNFYSKFLDDQIKNHTVYKEQLVFYLSNTVQVLASYAKNINELNEKHVPVVLETVGLMLLPQKESKYSSSINSDLKLTAYSIISVLASIIPFSVEILKSLTVSILEDKNSVRGFFKQTVIVLAQLWNSYQGGLEPLDCFKKLKFEDIKFDVLDELYSDKYNLSKFFMLYLIATFPSPQSFQLLNYVDLSNRGFIETTAKLVLANLTTQDELVRTSLVKIAQLLVKTDLDLFLSFLEQENIKIDDLELKLMSVLVKKKDNDEGEFNVDDAEEATEETEVLEHIDLDYVKAVGKSYFDTQYDTEFSSLLQSLSTALSVADIKSQVSVILSFLHKVFGAQEVGLTFIIRIALTPAVPISIRLSAIKALRIKIKRSAETDFYLLLPIVLLGLFEDSKSVRLGFALVLRLIIDLKARLHAAKKMDSTLALEKQIYGDYKDKKLPTFQDSLILCGALNEDVVKDIVLDPSRIVNVVFENIFKAKSGKSKPGRFFKLFILTQWALPFLPVVLKSRSWKIVADANKTGNDDRFFFLDDDIEGYFNKRNVWIEQASIAKVEFFDNVELSMVGLVGGAASSANEKNVAKEAEWLCKGLEYQSGNLQIAVNDTVLAVFDKFKAIDSKLKIVNKLLDLLIDEDMVDFDPMATLQGLPLDNSLFLQALSSVQIGDQMPEQGPAKRRRRSSNSAKQAMVRDEVNNMALTHLKKLTILLEVLESGLRKERDVVSPELLKALFKILTDLEYLGNDGNLPVLYAQETLASCMLLSIVNLKASTKEVKFDSNFIRADLIVNSIRSSHSPQVQNRLLLVISELASLAPEIILHSVMPIFTFMGAHTIRQDDEFSSSALQQTVAKVIPALAANGTSTVSNEVEFLLASFTTAFPHIPRHRRIKLFVSLTKTLGYNLTMHVILFLMGQQFANNAHKNKGGDVDSIIEFVQGYMKAFSAEEQLDAIAQFTKLWNEIPITQLEPGSEEFDALNTRAIFGTTIAGLANSGLSHLRIDLLQFLVRIIHSDNKFDVSSLKTKMALVLIDDEQDKEAVLSKFREVTSFALSSLDTFTHVHPDSKLCTQLYALLGDLLDLLPLNYFVDSIIASLDIDTLSDSLSIKVARNYAILATRKFETELDAANCDQSTFDSVIDNLLPVLIKGIKKNIDVELQQSYLDAFSTIVNKFGTPNSDFANSDISKMLIESLGIFTTDRGLLNELPEIVIASINAITSIVNALGVKTLGLFPKVVPPALKIWESTTKDDSETSKLLQGSVLVLLSCYIKKIPAFMTTTLDSVLLTILSSDLIEDQIRSSILSLIVDHMDLAQVLKSLCNVWISKEFYGNDNASNITLFLETMQSTIDKMEKKQAITQSTLFMKWLISAFEFRQYCEDHDDKFDANTIHDLEGLFHGCAIAFVMKLNDKSFRPLFANLVRWAIEGEGANLKSGEVSRLLAFFRFFNKLQDELKSIITSYYSYLLDPTSSLLKRFSEGGLVVINLRRLVLVSLTTSFKFDQDDYWSQQGRFDSICNPLLDQLSNIEDSIGKYLVKAISTFVTNVSSEEYNEALVHGLIKFISNENENSSSTKIWTIRTLKTIFQKMGEQWLTYLPTLVPYIAELLEDDDEEVEMEVRRGLIRVIENVLGEPLDRYLS